MKKRFFKTISFFTLLIVIGCTSAKVNLGLKLIGAYDDQIKLEKMTNKDKEVIFIPMIHIGTEPFYNDVKNKIDSLENLGFITYYEKVKSDSEDTISQRKLKKILGFPIPKKDAGYMSIIDSVLKVKLKKKLISQPSYKELGVDSLKGINVDISLKELIYEFEKRNGEIKLNECDFKTSIYQKTVCKDKPYSRDAKNEVVIDYRNKHVLETLLSDTHKKIIIIYGKQHFIGIKKELLNNGFITSEVKR